MHADRFHSFEVILRASTVWRPEASLGFDRGSPPKDSWSASLRGPLRSWGEAPPCPAPGAPFCLSRRNGTPGTSRRRCADCRGSICSYASARSVGAARRASAERFRCGREPGGRLATSLRGPWWKMRRTGSHSREPNGPVSAWNAPCGRCQRGGRAARNDPGVLRNSNGGRGVLPVQRSVSSGWISTLAIPSFGGRANSGLRSGAWARANGAWPYLFWRGRYEAPRRRSSVCVPRGRARRPAVA